MVNANLFTDDSDPLKGWCCKCNKWFPILRGHQFEYLPETKTWVCNDCYMEMI